jgi:tRNA-Thr(GGU) m(6)t(6)A37 methyltransferase TsaA
MPIQPSGAEGIQGKIEVFPEYVEGLKDVDGFSHLILLYQFHHQVTPTLTVTPFLDTQPRGVFSTRAPRRPNPIGLSVVKLDSLEGNILRISNVDILDGTPLLDIKPYIPEFDSASDVRTGWFGRSSKDVKKKKSDNRFRS